MGKAVLWKVLLLPYNQREGSVSLWGSYLTLSLEGEYLFLRIQRLNVLLYIKDLEECLTQFNESIV